MALPYEKNGRLCWGDISLELDNCTFGQIRSYISMPNIYQAEDHQYALFVSEIELGEVMVLVDMVRDKMLQLELELLDNLPLDQVLLFLQQEHIVTAGNFGYVEDPAGNFLVFNLHFAMRLSADTNKVSAFVFFNSDFIKQAEDDLLAKIRKTAKQKKQSFN